MNNIDRSIINIFENLFKPINNKDFGLYWLVSNKKAAPLDNAEALLKYINNKEYEKEGYFIERYANLTNDLILENNIYLDFDLNKKTYLKNEKGLTEEVLTDIKTGYPEEDEDKEGFKRLQNKINTNFSYDSGYTAGYKAFIDSLDVIEEKIVLDRVKDKEKEEIKGKSEKEIQQYYIYKFEQGYLKEPFQEVITVAKYLESIGLKVVLNLSGSKGFHLRIPITRITFKGTELEEKPENVKLFLTALVELIETKLLNVNIRSSSLDYNVLYKGMQRIPTSKHNKTKLHANFIHSSINYLEAIDKLKEEVPSYVPEVVNLEENTKNLTRSNIFKKAVEKAVEDSTLKTYESEAGNVNYKFKDTNNKKLVDVIKEFYPASKNFIPFKIMHLLKRSGFSKNEIEAIFHEVEPNLREYNRNFKGNVTYTFKENAKICGLRNLIEEINKRYPNNEKAAAVKYFMANFSSYEKPVENTLEETLTINGKEYKIIHSKTSKEEYYTIKDFLLKDHMLKIDKKKRMIQYKQDKKIISKLDLKAASGIQPKNEKLPDKFKDRIIKKTSLEEFPVEELIEELDYLFLFLEENEEDPVEIPEEKTDPDILHFGTEYIQTDKGIFKISISKNGNETKEPIANMIIKDVKITLDSLNIKEPVYTVTYYNRTFKKEKTVEHYTRKQLTEEFIKANVFYNSTKENVETVINTFIINGTQEGRIETNEEAYLEGFFLINGKIIENTNIKHIQKDYNELAEAINLFNEIMKDRTPEGKANDSSVYRFMLWSPFSYVFKQLGTAKASNYGLILTGKSQANKTGSVQIGGRFYNRLERENSGSTVSVLGSRLGESTFSSVFDECYNLLKQDEALDVSKRSTYETYARATKNRTDNTKIDTFPCLNIPTYLLNEGQQIEFKDFITNRFKIIDYSVKSVITTEDKKEFVKKYLPDNEDSILNKLGMIGRFFSDKLIAIIESKDISRLTKIEETTIEILKEISEETSKATGKPISFLPEMYTITEASTKYNYDVKQAVKNLFNEEFKKKNRIAATNTVHGHMFTQSITNNDFDFITYNRNTTEKTPYQEFIINASGITKYVNNHIEELVDLETILDYLGLTDILEKQQEKELKINSKQSKKEYKDYIRTQHNIKTGNKAKNIKGFHLRLEDLANHLFNFDIDFSKAEEEKNKG